MEPQLSGNEESEQDLEAELAALNDGAEEFDLEQELFPELSQEAKEELLLYVQGLGQETRVGNVKTYVKKDECLDSIKELCRLLRKDTGDQHLKQLCLGEWNIVASDLLKLLVKYPEDRQLAFYVIMLLVTLTEKPDKEHITVNQQIYILQEYKQAFISAKDAIKVLAQHIADCLTREDSSRNEKHDQMLELIIYLLRNLLAIPDRKRKGVRGTTGVTVYDAKEDQMKDLHFRFLHKLCNETILEALIYMCQDFTPQTMRKLNLIFLEIYFHIFRNFSAADLTVTTADYLARIRKAEQEAMKRIRTEIPSRHSKFGTNYARPRLFNGNKMIYTNPFQTRIDESHVPNQRHRVKPARRENLDITTYETVKPDAELCQKISKFSQELINHCFNPIMESVFPEFHRDSDRLQDEDRVHFFTFQAFMFEFLISKKAEGFNIGVIAEGLKIQNFEYMYRCFAAEIRKTSAKQLNAKEFQAAMKLFTQLLYVVQEMSNVDDETTKRNALILKQNIFYHEVSKVCRQAFMYWIPGFSPKSFLEEIVEFVDVCFSMLKDYSKGKLLSIRTEKLSRKAGDEEAQSTYQERQFSYGIEFSILIDYDVIGKYLHLLKSFKQNPVKINEYVARFIQRTVEDCKADWVFYQADFLSIFEPVLSAPVVHQHLTDVITRVVHEFFELLKVNRLLIVESLFRIRDKDVKNQILTNYESLPETRDVQAAEGDVAGADQAADDYALDEEDGLPQQTFAVKKWSLQEDRLLLQYYFDFATLENVHEICASYLPQKNSRQVKKRLFYLKVRKGRARAQRMLEETHLDEHQYQLQYTVPKAFEILGRDAVLLSLRALADEVIAFRQNVSATAEFTIVPKTQDEFTLYANRDYVNLLIGLGVRMPAEGEWALRVPGAVPAEDLYSLVANFTESEIVEPEESEEEQTYEAGRIIFKPTAPTTEDTPAAEPEPTEAVQSEPTETVEMPPTKIDTTEPSQIDAFEERETVN